MNPASNTATSGGLAFAVVVIINSWFIAFHFAPMDADVASAYAMVLTAGFGYFFHVRSLAAVPAPIAAIADPAKVAAAIALMVGFGLMLPHPAFAALPGISSAAGGWPVFATLALIALGLAIVFRPHVLVVCFVLAFGVLAACTKQEAANLQTSSQALVTGAAAIQQTAITLQPVASDAACAAQAGANLTATIATETHNADIANGAGTASKISGTFCNGLAKGAPLPQPVPVTGDTAVVNGVALPVPVAAVAASAK